MRGGRRAAARSRRAPRPSDTISLDPLHTPLPAARLANRRSSIWCHGPTADRPTANAALARSAYGGTWHDAPRHRAPRLRSLARCPTCLGQQQTSRWVRRAAMANGEATPLKGGAAATPHENSRGDSVVVHEAGLSEYKFKFSWRKLATFMGPGWVMSLAYLDHGRRTPPPPPPPQGPPPRPPQGPPPPPPPPPLQSDVAPTRCSTSLAPSSTQPRAILMPPSRHPRATLAPPNTRQSRGRPAAGRLLQPTAGMGALVGDGGRAGAAGVQL